MTPHMATHGPTCQLTVTTHSAGSSSIRRPLHNFVTQMKTYLRQQTCLLRPVMHSLTLDVHQMGMCTTKHVGITVPDSNKTANYKPAHSLQICTLKICCCCVHDSMHCHTCLPVHVIASCCHALVCSAIVLIFPSLADISFTG